MLKLTVYVEKLYEEAKEREQLKTGTDFQLDQVSYMSVTWCGGLK